MFRLLSLSKTTQLQAKGSGLHILWIRNRSGAMKRLRLIWQTAGTSLVTLMLLVAARADVAQAQNPLAAPDSVRQVVLVTGSTSGLGREVALRIAATGAHVIVHGRNRERGEEVVAQIESNGPGSARFYRADLASLAEVREFARQIHTDYDRLDILINNAGILATGNERGLSADGHELVFAVNYLAGFLLTRELLPLIRASAPARIINVSSIAQTTIDFEDVMLQTGYSGGRAYAQSKLAQIMFTFDLAEELKGSGVTVNALHPASMMATNMVISAGYEPRTTVAEGADALMQLVTGSSLGTGEYYNGLVTGRANTQAYDDDARAKLRGLSQGLTGTKLPTPER